MTSGLGARRVRAVAAAKHHTVVATESGEVFTWGSNRGKQMEWLMSFYPVFSTYKISNVFQMVGNGFKML